VPVSNQALMAIDMLKPTTLDCRVGGTVLRWNGTSWQRRHWCRVAAADVDAISATDVWAVGCEGSGCNSSAVVACCTILMDCVVAPGEPQWS